MSKDKFAEEAFSDWLKRERYALNTRVERMNDERDATQARLADLEAAARAVVEAAFPGDVDTPEDLQDACYGLRAVLNAKARPETDERLGQAEN